MNQIGNIFSQFNYQTQTAPPPPPPRGAHHAQHSAGTSQLPSSSYLSQLMSSSNNLFGGWQQLAGMGGYTSQGFDTSYANPGFNTAYANPGFNTSYAHPGFNIGGSDGSYGTNFGSAGLDMSSLASMMSNSLFAQSLGYSSGLNGLGLGMLSSAYPSMSTNAFPYELLLQGMPAMPQF